MKETAINDSQEIQIALFPIPGNVTFPYSVTTLHVFEPRYRKMIQDSIADKRRIGVAHTQAALSKKNKISPTATKEEILNTNQTSYIPYTIFSAGFAEIIQTLPDGRLLIEILMDARYVIKSELQQVPYKICLCEPYLDETENKNEDLQSRETLDQLLIELANRNGNDLKTFFEIDKWKNQTFEEYSFKIYSIVQFEPEILQNVLELKSSEKRIEFLIDFLTRGPLQS